MLLPGEGSKHQKPLVWTTLAEAAQNKTPNSCKLLHCSEADVGSSNLSSLLTRPTRPCSLYYLDLDCTPNKGYQYSPHTSLDASFVMPLTCVCLPKGSSYSTIMELALQNHTWYGFVDLIPSWYYIWTLLAMLCWIYSAFMGSSLRVQGTRLPQISMAVFGQHFVSCSVTPGNESTYFGLNGNIVGATKH